MYLRNERKERKRLRTKPDQFNDVGELTANENVCVRAGDTVLGRGELPRCPHILLVSSTGLGFAGLDVRGF